MTITRAGRNIAFEAPGIAELLIEEARRKGRRRRLARGGFVVAVVLTAAAISFAVLRGPVEPSTGPIPKSGGVGGGDGTRLMP